MGLKLDLIKVSGSNIVVLLASAINGFVLPYVLSIQGYADFRTYTLYATFIGLLHFGFVDGINVKYGGKKIDDIDLHEFNAFHSFFWSYQFFFSFFLLLIGLIAKNTILIFISVAVIPVNVQSFFLFFYQAIGEFSKYSKSTIIVPICSSTITVILLILGISNYEYYVMAIISSYMISVAFIEVNYFNFIKRQCREIKVFVNIKKVKNQFYQYKFIFLSGFYILSGTLLFNLFFDAARWIIKIGFDAATFANYSMAASLIGLIVVFVSAINKTLYPYIYHKNSNENILALKRILYIISSISLSSFFLIQKIIESFIPKYINSLSVTAVLFTSIPAIFAIKAIYANLYKINKQERFFLIDSIKYLIIALLLIGISYFIKKSAISIAIASVISLYVWTFFPSRNNLSFDESLIDMIYVMSIIICFIIIYYLQINFLLSFILFLSFSIMISLLFFKKILLKFFNFTR